MKQVPAPTFFYSQTSRIALSARNISWQPQKEKFNGLLLFLGIVGALIIGLTSYNIFAFLVPFAVIGIILGKFTWDHPEMILLLIVTSYMYAQITKVQDPLVFICFSILALRVILYGKTLKQHPITYLILTYIAYIVIGLSIGDDLAENLDYLITFIGLFCYYYTMINFFQNKKWILWYPLLLLIFYLPINFAYVYLFGTGQLGEFMTLGEVMEGFIKGVEIKPFLLFLAELTGERNFLTMNLQFAVGISIYIFWGAKKTWMKYFGLTSFLLMMATIVFSGSRGALLGLIIVLSCIFLYERKRKEVWLGALVLGIVAAILIPTVFAARFKTKEFNPAEDYSKFARKELLKNGLRMIRDHMFFGVGVRNYSWAFQKYYWKPIYIAKAFKNLEAHNMYVELWAEGGIFVFMIYMGILGTAWRNFHRAEQIWKHKDLQLSLLMRGAKIGFLGWMLCAFFISASVERNLWIIIGYSTASVLVAKKDQVKEDSFVVLPPKR